MKTSTNTANANRVGSTGGSAWISFDNRHPEIGQIITVKWKPPYENGDCDLTWGGAHLIDWKHECVPDCWKPWEDPSPNAAAQTRRT